MVNPVHLQMITRRSVGLVLLGTCALAPAAEPIVVSVAPLDAVATAATRDAPASVIGLFRSTLAAELHARVEVLHVEVGDAPAAGAALVSLDCREYTARLRQAQALLRALEARRGFAEYRVDRARSLAGRDALAEEVLRQRESELATLAAERGAQQAALDNAQLQVERCVIRAPYAGVVVERRAQPGELAAPGSPLVTLVDAERVEVQATLRRELVADLEQADMVLFDSGSAQYPVRRRVVLPTVDPRSDGQELRLEFSAARAAPGTPGRLRWRLAGRMLPPHLLERRAGQLGVFVLDESGTRARFHPLPGAQEGRPAALDLPGDTRVVLEGRGRLQDADPVRALP
jgi:RND family efflux transporter MFP subunit